MIKCHVAIMQPYVFPYIGYFHLIHASSVFVFYDDVYYIKQGWINRNRILNQETDFLFTIPVHNASSNRLIKDIYPTINTKWKDKFYKQLFQNYKKAPFFLDVIEPIMSVFSKKYSNVADLAIESISAVFSYLDIDYVHTRSSICSPATMGMDKADRLIEMTKELGFRNYVNAKNGNNLYSKEYFFSQDINLSFLKSNLIEYRQHSDQFVPWLSIIDIIMFNSKEHTIDLLSEYTLE